jgi:hypothetical protein
MKNGLGILLVLALVGVVAGPAMADVCTFTNSSGDNDYGNAANWTIAADANGGAYSWGGLPEAYGCAAVGAPNWQTVVFGAGQVGNDSTWQAYVGGDYNYGLGGTDIVTFVGNNNFAVTGGGFNWDGAFQINVLGQATFTIGQLARINGNVPAGTPLTINTVVGSKLILSYTGRSDSSYDSGAAADQTIINGGGTVELDTSAVTTARFTYCNLVLNAVAGNSPVVNAVNVAYEQEVETLVGTGTVNFSSVGGSNPWGASLDSTTGFTGTVTVQEATLGLGGSAVTNVAVNVGDYARLVFTGASPVITGGSITGGGPSASAVAAGNSGVYGNVCVDGTVSSTTLTLLGTTIMPSTAGNSPIYNGAGAQIGTTVASAAGKLVISSNDDWGLNGWAPFALTLGKNGSTAAQLGIAVVGLNQVAGVDFSQVKVVGTLSSVSQPTGNPLADTSLLVNITPGMTPIGINDTNLGSSALYGQTLTILTVSATDLSTATFGAGVVGTDILFKGGFATVNYASDGNGGGVVTLSNIFSNPTLAGDANNDGQVNGADYAFWAANYGANNATWLQGDFNGDAQVNGADYAIWAANYGTGSGTSATPEPISMIILAIGGGLVALKRRTA